jgi:hypothetical protein
MVSSISVAVTSGITIRRVLQKDTVRYLEIPIGRILEKGRPFVTTRSWPSAVTVAVYDCPREASKSIPGASVCGSIRLSDE